MEAPGRAPQLSRGTGGTNTRNRPCAQDLTHRVSLISRNPGSSAQCSASPAEAEAQRGRATHPRCTARPSDSDPHPPRLPCPEGAVLGCRCGRRVAVGRGLAEASPSWDSVHASQPQLTTGPGQGPCRPGATIPTFLHARGHSSPHRLLPRPGGGQQRPLSCPVGQKLTSAAGTTCEWEPRRGCCLPDRRSEGPPWQPVPSSTGMGFGAPRSQQVSRRGGWLLCMTPPRRMLVGGVPLCL